MITTNWCEISPAYGRDYKSGKNAKADFLAGKDFKMESIIPLSNGTYCSIRDFTPGLSVLIRYKHMEQVMSVKVPTPQS
jgi:hypothetical protein